MKQHFSGYCNVCEKVVVLELAEPNFYRSLRCTGCGCWPAQRAFWHVLTTLHPDWRDKVIHESSAGHDAVTSRFLRECPNYIVSQYDKSVPPGTEVKDHLLPGGIYIAQDLQAQSFPDAVFDIVVTREVFEHVFDPASAMSEIARTLKPGGACIVAVPVVNGFNPSQRRASLQNGIVHHLLEAQYHGNHMESGALVAMDWGYDIVNHFSQYSGMDFSMGIFSKPDGIMPDEFNQILFAIKRPRPNIS